MIIKDIDKDCRVYLNSEDEKFKLLYLESCLTYEYISWKLDKGVFVETYYILCSDQLLNSGQTFIDLRCASVEEYMQVFSYFIGHGWYNRIRWDKTFIKNNYGPDDWDKYCNKKAYWFTYESFYNYYTKETLLGLLYDLYELSLFIKIKVDYNKLEEFRELLKGLGKFGYKIAWLGYDKETNRLIDTEIR